MGAIYLGVLGGTHLLLAWWYTLNLLGLIACWRLLRSHLRLTHSHHGHSLLLLLLHLCHLLCVQRHSLARHSLLLDHHNSLVGLNAGHDLALHVPNNLALLHHLTASRVHAHGRSPLHLRLSCSHHVRHPLLVLLQHHHPRTLAGLHPWSHDAGPHHALWSHHGSLSARLHDLLALLQGLSSWRQVRHHSRLGRSANFWRFVGVDAHRLLLLTPVVLDEHVVLSRLLPDLLQGLLDVRGACGNALELGLVLFTELVPVFPHRPLLRIQRLKRGKTGKWQCKTTYFHTKRTFKHFYVNENKTKC